MRSFLAAIGFLTRIPVPGASKALEKSAIYFPVVGLLIGILLYFTYTILISIFPPDLSRVLILVISIIIYGAFHLDGLADMFDGFYAGTNREERLKIMDDPLTGVMGILAIVCALLIKSACFIILEERWFVATLLCAPVVGHLFMLSSITLLPYAKEKGLGKIFSINISIITLVIYSLFIVLFIFAFLKLQGVIALLIVKIFVFLLLTVSKSKIGGITGDICGAVNEIAELTFFVSLVSLSTVSFSPLEQLLPLPHYIWLMAL